jgi:hypothetical protein
MDWVLLLTPLLVLGVVLLLGFAGCSFEHGRFPPSPRFEVRVPSTLTVTRLTFKWTPPGGMEIPLPIPDPTPTRIEDGQNVFEHNIPEGGSGQWMTSCEVRVREGTRVAADEATGDFPLDDSLDDPVVTYQASGAPSSGDFTVIYAGLFEGAMA